MPVFEALADALQVLITVDRVVADNEELDVAWRRYKRLIQNARAEPDSYGLDTSRQAAFERMLVSLDAGLMGSGSFQQCIDQDFEVPGPEETSRPMVEVRNNRVFLDEMRAIVRAMLQDATARIGSASELGERRRLVGVVGLYALYRRLLPAREPPDEKLYRQLWETQRASPLVTLHCATAVSVGELLTQHAPLPVRKLSPRDVTSFLRDSARGAADAFARRTQHRYGQVCAWLVHMESSFDEAHGPGGSGTGAETAEQVRRLARLLEAGVLLAHAVKETMAEFINLHSASEFPLQKKSVPDVCRCCEMLKAIEAMFTRKVRGCPRPRGYGSPAGVLQCSLKAFMRGRGRRGLPGPVGCPHTHTHPLPAPALAHRVPLPLPAAHVRHAAWHRVPAPQAPAGGE